MRKFCIFCLLFVLTIFNTSAQFFQWAKKQENNTGSVSVASGNSLVATTGTFSSRITIGNQTFTSQDSNNAYLAVYDLSGNLLWAKKITGSGAPLNSGQGPSITVDANDNIILAGIMLDSLYIDGLLFKSSTLPAFGLYTAKFSPTGTLLWAQSSNFQGGQFHYLNFITPSSIDTDAAGNVLVAGHLNFPLTFNGITLTPNNASNTFLIKYNASGTLQWGVLSPNGINYTYLKYGIKIKATPAGNIYFTGYSFNNFNIFLTKFSPSGAVLWNKNETSFLNNGLDITIDNNDNAYITAQYADSVTVGTTTLHSTGSNYLLAKINSAGNWQWVKNILDEPSNLYWAYNKLSIVYTPGNALGLAGSFSGTALFNNTPITYLPNPPNNTENIFVAKLDMLGTPIWVSTVSATTDGRAPDISTNATGNFFLAGNFRGTAQFNATTLTSSSNYSSFLTKVNNEGNSVSGTIFIDTNKNGIKDASETGFGELMIGVSPGPRNSISFLNGTYNAAISTGTSFVSLPNPPRHYTFVPASHTVTFSGTNQTQTGKDFALQPIPNSNDVKVTVTNLTPARPGFQANYRLTFHNAGTTVLSDTVKLSHNTNFLSFVSSTLTPATNSNGKMAWYYQNLLPNETRNIDVTFSVPATTVLGTSLQAIANIKPFAIDLFQADNIDTLKHVVIGSFDPNDKQVDKTTLSPAQAATGEYLDYTIRFQNTGTDTAFTVVVTDRILSQLNLANFEMLSASHAYKLNVIDGNMLEWRFDNILLPDSNRNEPASHGFIRFRLKSKAGLQLGDSITNQAAIYFDYNAPVITNHAVTKVANPNGIKEKKASIQAFKLYPNPAKNYVMVNAEFKKNTSATVSLVNLLGQTLSNVTLPANNQIHYQLPLKDLPKGVYLIRLETETGLQTQRLVVQ
ncbi:T9SS type A sorting domain-containing protein [Adhaeribacter sp. BT258]|uniref:T9SS type A sorting domain-containing protein n=1 Tax=Adhaeribacter terrigena TaxID=2793070 RepID=A0ABS1C3T7_9BACT|nr:T9SS type A sorting domain-containing protein [Adhaeribacter terrigena]MBK0404065.1 T9SS type A sorting domain-containing protein [Adhaeribacter terrigena]